MRSTLLLLFFTCVSFLAFGQKKQVQGRLLDQQTQQGIAFAHIGFPKLGKGTISNEQGFFKLELEDIKTNDSVKISCIGYQSLVLKITDLSKEIYLQQSQNQLEEITIEQQSAKSIVRQAIANIEQNYDFGGLKYEVYTRGQMFTGQDTTLEVFTEVVFDMYYPSQERFPTFEVLKARSKSFGEDGSRLKQIQRKIFIHAFANHEFRPYSFYLARKKNFKKYQYKLEDIVEQDNGENTYVISAFRSKKHPKFVLHINQKDYAFSYIKSGNDFSEEDFKTYTDIYFQEVNQKWYLQKVQRVLKSKAGVFLPKSPEKYYETRTTSVITKLATNLPPDTKINDNLGIYTDFLEPLLSDFNDAFWNSYNTIPFNYKVQKAVSKSTSEPDNDTFSGEHIGQELLRSEQISPQELKTKGKFSIRFPNKIMQSGRINIGSETNSDIWYFHKAEKEIWENNTLQDAHLFALAYRDTDGIDKSQILPSVVDNLITHYRLEKESIELTEVQDNRYTRLRLTGEDDGIFLHFEIYQTKTQLYLLILASPDKQPSPEEVKAFVSSFKIE